MNSGLSSRSTVIKVANWQQDQKELIELRTRVFIEEQKVPPELEIDGLDDICIHLKALTDSGQFIGTSRLLPSHYIGRMCVLKEYRHQGAGSQMLNYFIHHALVRGIPHLMLNAQLTALPFYQQFGFLQDSDVFIEADIEHVHMTLTLAELRR